MKAQRCEAMFPGHRAGEGRAGALTHIWPAWLAGQPLALHTGTHTYTHILPQM